MFPLDWSLLTESLLKMGGAFLIAFPVAWEREQRTRIMGLRTFPIVAMATCAYILIAEELFSGNPEAQARVVQGLVAGMGFIGGGAILKRKATVRGTATAASIWATGAMGAAVAFGHLEIALSASVIIFLTLRVLTPLEERIDSAPADRPDARGDVGDDDDLGATDDER